MDEKNPPVNDSRRRDARRASSEELSRLLAIPKGLPTAARQVVLHENRP